MSLTLILIRHAKSSWDDPLQADHDRPLNDRGRDAAPKIGQWLAGRDLTPQTVLSSPARRTQETWSAIATTLLANDTVGPELIFTSRLYHASPERMLGVLREAKGDVVALIGHNPGIGSLAWSLCQTPPAHSKFQFYPTGATLILRFDANSWAEIGPGQGQVEGFVVPRDLN